MSRCILLVQLMWLLPSIAAATDLHWLWDDRCAECHGHSADFARRFLQFKDGQLQGRHQSRDLRLFLRNHYSPWRAVDAIYDMLSAQAQSTARYRVECSHCHGSAAAFIRASLMLQDSVLLRRESQQPMIEFMQTHRNLNADDIEFYVKLLNRVANEVYAE